MVLDEHSTTTKMTFINSARILVFMQKAIPDVTVNIPQIVIQADNMMGRTLPKFCNSEWMFAGMQLIEITINTSKYYISRGVDRYSIDITYSSACPRSLWLLLEGSIPVHSLSLPEHYGPVAGEHILEDTNTQERHHRENITSTLL